MDDLTLFATTPRGIEPLLTGELRQLGAKKPQQRAAGVAFLGTLETAYRVCLWSRLSSRILLQLTTGEARDASELYATVRSVCWADHVPVSGTVAVTFTGTSDSIRDTRFGAVRVKDAIVDQFRETHGGARPSVDTRSPDLRVHAHLSGARVAVSIDLSGDSLHRRGYRPHGARIAAPLKENLAAAVLVYAGWPRTVDGASLLDPLCGSGTLVIEAAMIAADIAPGLLRASAPQGFGFVRWEGHDEGIWRRLVAEATQRRRSGLLGFRTQARAHTIMGSDKDDDTLRIAQASADRAGLDDVVMFARTDLADVTPGSTSGLLATNVPYGERLGDRRESLEICRLLGRRLHGDFHEWSSVVLMSGRDQLRALGLKTARTTTVYNGALPCILAYDEPRPRDAAASPRSTRAMARSSARTISDTQRARSEEGPRTTRSETAEAHSVSRPSEGVEQLRNRLRKNRRHVEHILRRENVSCYRLYDADLPDFNVTVDVYGDFVHLQEYAAPPEIDQSKAARRLIAAVEATAEVLDVPRDHIVVKRRQRQRGATQYGPLAQTGRFHRVDEDGLTCLVNLHDYIDTGFFIDQRLTRRLVRSLSGGRRFLNLFAYTGTMTVNALAGGSPSTTSVDLSSTYLEWAQRNIEANGFHASLEQFPAASSGAAHTLVKAECLQWMTQPADVWDLIWLDPPTFSNSKRMGQTTFDVQRDHVDLIRLAIRRLLAPNGILLFSTNRHNFRLSVDDLVGAAVEDLSQATLPPDCARSASRHHIYRITRSPEDRQP